MGLEVLEAMKSQEHDSPEAADSQATKAKVGGT
jgi:hypothetical protein